MQLVIGACNKFTHRIEKCDFVRFEFVIGTHLQITGYSKFSIYWSLLPTRQRTGRRTRLRKFKAKDLHQDYTLKAKTEAEDLKIIVKERSRPKTNIIG